MHSGGAAPVVLATVPYYFPGFCGGGKPIALRNLIAALRGECSFMVLTANHDLGDPTPYGAVQSNRWMRGEGCAIFYLGASAATLPRVRATLSGGNYDILYLNTVFSRPFGILPLILHRFGAIPGKPLVIAPRGELAPGALAIKSRRKRGFLAAARALRLFDDATWQASGETEARDIRVAVGGEARISIAADVPAPDYRSRRPSAYRKTPGRLDIMFLSRITPIKNLHLAIEALRGLEGEITFRIVGPIDDARYWERCRKQIATLDSHIRIDYLGPIPDSEVSNYLRHHGLLFLPTAGESFGFVILEALLAGCPVLISDRTPWRDLTGAGIGWDLPLVRADLMQAALRQCVAMDADAHRTMSLRAREFALAYLAREDSAARHLAMFRAAAGHEPARRLSA
ncbi:MAG TPA: glycosyltransferase family 4 protein [Candidatus Binataceae bacterium]|nr:glycosyltransferase family 4 protein [Candidatus Binataceae bacterium]